MVSYSTKAFQDQSAFGSSGAPPMHINDATHVSSWSIPSNTNDTFDMSTFTSNVLRNDDTHASNTTGTVLNEGCQASSTASFSSIVALKGKYFETVSNFNTLTDKKSTDIAYLTTTDERRAFMSEIKTLKLAVLKTTITTIGFPNWSIVSINIEIFLRQLETAQRKYDLVFSKMQTTLVHSETPYF
ncbi:hypothetical protein [Parasitella parasitica]|uniref:Uncharacterized protein n=1 Tax=Parasitella parasitica TaxID=35722 RepID=A0A0B7NR15_9FUNG|nr:hypothetical protein [Parasitella parasitica]